MKKRDNRLAAVCELIQNQTYSVDSLSKAVNVSTVTLRNLFRDCIGLSPKDLIRISRVNSAMKNPISSEKLTQIAYKMGYFDQSHFIHEFKAVTGLTPKEYFGNQSLTFDFYNYGRLQVDNFAVKKP